VDNRKGDDQIVDRTRPSQPPLEPGWWKTGAGWKSVLKSNRIDPRAKFAVIALIVFVFVLFGLASDWSGWIGYGSVAAALVVAVLVFSPKDPDERS